MTDYDTDYEGLSDDHDPGSLRAMIQAQNAILRELFDLLNQYAPMWYSVGHHNRLAKLLEGDEHAR